MTETVSIERKTHFLIRIGSAFDLSSDGMGVHLAAVRDYFTKMTLSMEAKTSLAGWESNYLVNPYAFAWLTPTPRFINLGLSPRHLSPLSADHRRLFQTTQTELTGLRWWALRIALTGEDTVPAKKDPCRPIDKEELSFYLQAGNQRGLLKFAGEVLPTIDLTNVTIDQELRKVLIRAGVNYVDNELFRKQEEIVLYGELASRTRQAAVHKLGCMIGITDQIIYDAYKSGCPVPASWQPDDMEQAGNWRRVFDRERPSIEELYREAYTVFANTASSEDPLISYLLAKPPDMSYFAR